MSAKSSKSPDTSDRELVIARPVNAPRELVFEVWTDPKHVVHWWGPTGFTNTIKEISVKPGGVWRFIMHGPDGTDYPNRISFIEVVKPERLVYDHGSDDDNRDADFHTVVTFEAQQNQTLVTMRSIFPTAEALALVVEKYGAIEGGKQHLARLDEYVSNRA